MSKNLLMVIFMSCPIERHLKTAVSHTHLDVLQRDISIEIYNPMDVGLRCLTRVIRWTTYILWIEAYYQGH